MAHFSKRKRSTINAWRRSVAKQAYPSACQSWESLSTSPSGQSQLTLSNARNSSPNGYCALDDKPDETYAHENDERPQMPAPASDDGTLDNSSTHNSVFIEALSNIYNSMKQLVSIRLPSKKVHTYDICTESSS
jgi:hypothetical protein